MVTLILLEKFQSFDKTILCAHPDIQDFNLCIEFLEKLRRFPSDLVEKILNKVKMMEILYFKKKLFLKTMI